MNIEAPFEANSTLAESGEPGMRALDGPTMPSQPFATFDTTPGDTGLDAALSQITPATREGRCHVDGGGRVRWADETKIALPRPSIPRRDHQPGSALVFTLSTEPTRH